MKTIDSPAESFDDALDTVQRRSVWRANALALFLPTIVVGVGYALLLLALHLDGRGGGALARVCLLVLGIGVPLLFAYAGLRLSTIQLTFKSLKLEIHTGFPARDPVSMPYSRVKAVHLRHGLSGWITGAGTLVIEREGKPPLVVAGLSDPRQAIAELDYRRSLMAAVSTPAA